MKRLEIEPTIENILQALSSDLAHRNEDIVGFIQLIESIQGPYTIMLDAPWGEGKTFFVKTIEYALHALNKKIRKDTGADSNNKNGLVSQLDSISTNYLPIYFNAWANDYAEDPLSALFATMAIELDDLDSTYKKNLIEGITAITDLAIKSFGIGVSLASIKKAISGEDLIETYRNRSNMRNKINELAKEKIGDVADKLVIFIDELDRCRPDFSVRLLEQTKNMLQSDNIITVISADSVQLSNALAGMYGNGFDSPLFLERFFDLRITLPPADPYELAYGKQRMPSSYKFDALVNELLYSRPLTTRDVMGLNKIDAAKKLTVRAQDDCVAYPLIVNVAIPLLIFIERENPPLFRAITRGENFEALYEYGRQFNSVKRSIDSWLSLNGRNYINADNDTSDHSPSLFEPTDELRMRCMRDLCTVLFNREAFSSEYNDASNRLDSAPGSKLIKICKTLNFV